MATEYISRDAAIEALCKAHSPYPRRREISVRAIQEITAAYVREVVRGRWIVMEDLYGERALCSACGFGICVNEPGNGLPMVERLSFCPACGADMRPREEDGNV